MASNLVVVIFWITISGSLSRTWSSSINSLFARNSRHGEIAVNKALMESVGIGAQMALEHCQDKFKWDRWNCPESAFSRRSTQPLTRETAFTLALKSAGIIYAITQNCSRGELAHCGCDPSYSSAGGYVSSPGAGGNPSHVDSGAREAAHWTWGGCSQSLDYGEKVAEKLLGDEKRDWTAMVEKHNYEVGKMVVRATLQKQCRCHGVSGSCSLQTCWVQMAPFSVITNELRAKYENAQKIDHDKKFNSVGDFNVVQDVQQEEIIYLSDSPNYCKADVITGWNGTLNRACSRNKGDTITPAERKSCRSLCRSCGHRVRRERRRVTRRCNCSFMWCCEVHCDTCSDILDEYFCD